MRGILIDPGQPPEVRNIPDTAQGLDAYLGGAVRIKPFSTQPAALAYVPCLAGQAMPTRLYGGAWYFGRLLIVGWRRSRLVPLPEPLARELAEYFAPMEVSRL
ncbi:hypothetical protein [uncultured Subdoligranulum sp.]|uniref:hypothetical protein n=1 Tax=uncultured Subdoligranulum sp. TaxID=512298 RepID=UPI00261AF1D0|nr:hypothetical protein [uncultured Subdoligranulum sp.]